MYNQAYKLEPGNRGARGERNLHEECIVRQ